MCEVRGLDQKSWAQTLQKQGSLFSGPRQRAPRQEGLGDNRPGPGQSHGASKLSACRALPEGLLLAEAGACASSF